MSVRVLRVGLGLAIGLGAACGEDTTGGTGDAGGDTSQPLFDTTVVTATDTGATDTGATGATDTGTTGATDTGATGATDTGGGDADVVIQPGEFGYPCASNEECFSGYCVEGPDGFVCTRTCDQQCPPGWDCKGIAGRIDIVFLCQPRLDRLCAPCTEDLQCNGGACLVVDGEQRCVRACVRDDDCPVDYTCVPDGEAGNDGHCQPTTGSCTCSAEVDGGLRTCSVTNAEGTCFGTEDCDPATGWSACSARTPAAEQCNGQDDDCDAFVDEDLEGVGAPCDITVAGVGTCVGTRVCAGVAGLQCQGATPEAETCDFADEDCDGQVDEDFKDGDVYSDFAHCGTCNRSCAIGFPNAQQTACVVEQGVAQCVVVACEPGYIKQNDFQCIPDVVNLCEPCSDDANCLGQGSACVTLADGRFCAKSCQGAADCPLGFGCQEVGEATKQCVPTTGVCSCGPSTQGLSRACSETVSPPNQPSYTCAGTETCGAAGWGACAMPTEACNSIDDDCDATTDEGFKNAQGEYDKVDNCGACGVSCLALDYPHSAPACDAAGAGLPRCGYVCDPGWVDVDAAPGCDCQPTSQTDLPDVAGVDADCDGIDGEIDKAVFVAKTGDDAGLGTIDDPLRTIQAGIARAVQLGRRDVLVATGVYEESVALANAVSVYGGYAPSFGERDIDVHESAILGAAPTDALRGAVNATALGTTAGQALTFDGFSVFGADNPSPSGNSYAIYLRNVGAFVTVTNNYVVAGNGGAGDAGTKGADGTDGSDGSPGTGAATTGTTCSAANHAAGGAGGARTCEVDVGGGAGGTRVCPVAPDAVRTALQTPTAAEYGRDGANHVGSGGEPGWHDNIIATGCDIVSSSNTHDSFGAIGDDGADGANGASAASCVAGGGSVTADGQWQSPAAGTGSLGTSGQGGGGGGAAGGIDHLNTAACTNANVPFVVGGSGGGGGSGGCRGGVGTSGGSGGGSFGVFLAYATAPAALPSIRSNVVYRGVGGRGGSGGAGGVGGSGGFGADGGSSNHGAGGFPQVCCASGGGAGGNGGAGGHGPGGAGGCGGASYSLYIAPVALGVPRTSITGNTFPIAGVGGIGGPGGTSLGNVGLSGGDGLWAITNF